MHWWPLTRDCLAYGVTVTILICIIHDERVEWHEALVLVALYTVYIAGDLTTRFLLIYKRKHNKSGSWVGMVTVQYGRNALGHKSRLNF